MVYIEIHKKSHCQLKEHDKFFFHLFRGHKIRVLNHMGVAEGICKFENAGEPWSLNHSCNADGWSQEGKFKFLNLKFRFSEFLFPFHCLGVSIGM